MELFESGGLYPSASWFQHLAMCYYRQVDTVSVDGQSIFLFWSIEQFQNEPQKDF